MENLKCAVKILWFVYSTYDELHKVLNYKSLLQEYIDNHFLSGWEFKK